MQAKQYYKNFMQVKKFTHNQPFYLESGRVLQGFHLAYTTLGKLNADKTNAVWIFHALTANSNPAEWWPGMVGEKCLFDPEKIFYYLCKYAGQLLWKHLPARQRCRNT